MASASRLAFPSRGVSVRQGAHARLGSVMIQVARMERSDVDAGGGDPVRRVRRRLPPARPRAAVPHPGQRGLALSRLPGSRSRGVRRGLVGERGRRGRVRASARRGHQHRSARLAPGRAGRRGARADGGDRAGRRAVEQPAAVPGQLQSRLVRPLRPARLRGRRRGPLSARREADSARRSARHACGRCAPTTCPPSSATIGPARSPTGAATSPSWRRPAAGSSPRARPARRRDLRAISSTGRCPPGW